MSEDIIIVTGGFDPIHSGHIEYINNAAKLGRVVVGLNSDEWLSRKKGKPFMSYDERYSIVSNLKNVMCAIAFDDSDNSAIDAIKKVRQMFPKNKIVFANGGDRTVDNIPEMSILGEDQNLQFVFGVGGDNKKNSSSWLLNDWKSPGEKRVWGKFLTYYDSNLTKVKRLLLEPGKSISMQFHAFRSELWFVESGVGEVSTLAADGVERTLKTLNLHDYHEVPRFTWHRLKNTGKEPLSIIEIQYGEACIESDIVRF